MESINNIFVQSKKFIANNFFNKIQKGSLLVTFPDNKKKLFKGVSAGHNAEIRFNNYKVFSKLFFKGSIGFGESYMDGDFETNNLSKLLLFAYDNEDYFLKNKKAKNFLRYYIKFKHYLNENTKSKSKKNISFHYDLGNDFYELWLDQSMTYSSAIFCGKNKNLYDAQINKYKQIAYPLNLNENSNLLEIGCGWGGFSTYVAKEFGSKVKAITISKEQYNFTAKRIFEEGLNEKISIEMRDYRDIQEKYSSIASIEMFEAVGKKYWEIFLETLKKSMTKNGSASLQIITINEEKKEYYQHNPDFIQQYIFPGGILPSKKQLININKRIGLNLVEIKNYKNSYAKTLNEWNNKFQESWPKISSLGFNLRFKKMWEYYLSYCEVGFIAGTTDVSQFIIRNKN